MDNYSSGRQKRGFLSVQALVDEICPNNTVLDVNSVLVAEDVAIGNNNIFYPGVVIERQGDGKITIGDDNVFYPGVYVVCSAGEIVIGDANEFGPSGLTIKSNMPTASISIGSQGRYCDGANIMGKTSLGSGSQVLGNITVQNCRLSDGGNFKEPDPDTRAAVLKGFGLARDITVEKGQVINGAGDFSKASVEWQRAYHPKAG